MKGNNREQFFHSKTLARIPGGEKETVILPLCWPMQVYVSSSRRTVVAGSVV